MTCRRTRRAVAQGFAYVEVLVALVLVVVALVPALEALQSGVHASREAGGVASKDALLRAKMEEALARPFDELNAQTFLVGGNTTASVSAALSDASGAADRRVVILYRSDGSALSSADTGLLRLRVAYEAGGLALETMKSKWW
jgi:Tfp pilus assembly protein PilV